MTALLYWSVQFALGCLTLALLLALARVLIGPRAHDRVVAYDSLYQSVMLVILVLGLMYRSSSYFETALLLALYGFVGSTAMAKFLLRGEVIE
jgi:multicomponent K+:H+ antiporter subunit F